MFRAKAEKPAVNGEVSESDGDARSVSAVTRLLKPGDKPLDYLQYLRVFATFSASRANKEGEYAAYLRDLLDYLVDFFRRTQPLFDLDAKLEEVEEEFARLYRSGELRRRWQVKKENGEGEDKMDTEEPEESNTYCEACTLNTP